MPDVAVFVFVEFKSLLAITSFDYIAIIYKSAYISFDMYSVPSACGKGAMVGNLALGVFNVTIT